MSGHDLSKLAVDDCITFVGEKRKYTIQARNDRYLICTKPFAARKTVIYTIVDIEGQIRGTDNMVFGWGYETRKQCEDNLARLASEKMEVSYRNRVPLDIQMLWFAGRESQLSGNRQ